MLAEEIRRVANSEQVAVPRPDELLPRLALALAEANYQFVAEQASTLAKTETPPAPAPEVIEPDTVLAVPENHQEASVATEEEPPEIGNTIPATVEAESQKDYADMFKPSEELVPQLFNEPEVETTNVIELPLVAFKAAPEDSQPELSLADELSTNLVAHMELEESEPAVAEQLTVLVYHMPEAVQAGLAEYIQAAAPEELATTEQLLVQIAQAADRLHELAMTERDDTPEATMIEELLGVWYEELLTTLAIAYDEADIITFIALVRSEAYQILPEAPAEDWIDEGMRNFKRGLSTFAQSLAEARETLTQEIGRLVLQQGAA